MVSGAHSFIAFAKSVFGATELRRFDAPDGRIQHAELRIDDSIIMLAEGAAEWPPFSVWLHIYVPDVHASYQRALEAGRTAVQEPTEKPGDPDIRSGVMDPSGITWWISTQQASAP